MSQYEGTYQESGTVFEETAHGSEAPQEPTITQLPGTQLPGTQLPGTRLPGTQLPGSNNAQQRPPAKLDSTRLTQQLDDGATNGGQNEPSLLRNPQNLRKAWESVQVGFVDNPRQAVGEAESLVSSAIDEIVSGFRCQSARLEAEWSQGQDASTDELRMAFQRYREFFGRLLEV